MAGFTVMTPRLRVLALVLCFASSVVGLQVETQPNSDFRSECDSLGLEKRAAPSFYARIMPLGASIVWGYNTPDGNGFRKPLRDELTDNGWKVDMVGSKQHGTMADNEVEAHPGDVIDQIAQAALNSVKYQPNIVLINAGNNDCHQNLNISFAGYRMGKLLDELYDKIPGVTVVLSTLVLSTNSAVEKNRGSVNSQIRTLVDDRLKSKNKIVLAEMTGDGSTFVQQADLTSDGVHPNEAGANKMGHIFYQAIVKANDNGMLTKPTKTDFSTVENSGTQLLFTATTSLVEKSDAQLSVTTPMGKTTASLAEKSDTPISFATTTSLVAILQTKQASGPTPTPSISATGNSSMLTPTAVSPTGSSQASSTNILSDGHGAGTSAAGPASFGSFGLFGMMMLLVPLFL